MNKIVAYTLGVSALIGVGITHANFESSMIDPSIQVGNFCSGTVIADPDPSDGIQKTIMTAKHCTDAVGQKIIIEIPQYDDTGRVDKFLNFEFVVSNRSALSDLALLQLPNSERDQYFKIPEAMIYDGSLEFGQKYWVVGNPLGLPKLITEGFLGNIMKLPALKDMSTSQEFRLGTAAIAGGNSGGGIFVKNWFGQYELAGTVSAGIMNIYTVTTNIGCYTPLEEVEAFLKDFKSEVFLQN